MTPSARLQAAIETLDQIIGGAPAEKALTAWARGSRFAGSGDRAAVRDHVFDVLRMWRSCAAHGGIAADAAPVQMPGVAETEMRSITTTETPPGGTLSGRALILGLLRQSGDDVDALFNGQGHGPATLTMAERGVLAQAPDIAPLVALDCPDWLAPTLRADLGEDFSPVMEALRSRAPVFIRVNTARAAAADVRAELAQQGITAQPHPLSPTALHVTDGARRLRASAALADGRIEMQDAASQAVVDMIEGLQGARVLDFCAGGGGKALALAAKGAQVFAHDANPARMADLPARAARAGVSVPVLSTADLPQAGPFDVIVADVPCSGSGSWRRAPTAKWALTPERLAELVEIQAGILDQIAALAGPKTRLVYITCTLLACENADQIAAFLARNPGWRPGATRRLTPCDGGDGFFTAQVHRA
ncbi:RsmB/NOP family class I SAM-dependent RNA methyltransferase [Roseicitreum antarcticum]|uniref:16S rRNA (Cytosine967-C5)-methyltransferase n=1 Tax=Roseicitreum antarcticum TaxID=564137 RepID=A0A1H3CCP4_9RHOB|nr:RsmB/NOP family class I SAM-dependent RNA methyltransferase [Roseicitreum antarcticum]SDX51259.1 16S rRNA (cytosine967-C5)-methyltransferase [Roseicitreum antarcticum]